MFSLHFTTFASDGEIIPSDSRIRLELDWQPLESGRLILLAALHLQRTVQCYLLNSRTHILLTCVSFTNWFCFAKSTFSSSHQPSLHSSPRSFLPLAPPTLNVRRNAHTTFSTTPVTHCHYCKDRCRNLISPQRPLPFPLHLQDTEVKPRLCSLSS